MKKLIILLGLLTVAFSIFAASATASVKPFVGNSYCIGGHTVVSTNWYQDAFLNWSAKYGMKVSTDEEYGLLAPYGYADRDADDVAVALGACPVATQPPSSAFFCKFHDNNDQPLAFLAVGPKGSTVADAVADGRFAPVAVLIASPAAAILPHPTVIGGVSKNPWYELRCGGTPASPSLGVVDKNGDWSAPGSYASTQPDHYPIGN